MDVIHTAIWVSDLDATEAFYVDALGLSHTWDFVGDDGVTNFYVGGGEGDGAEIQFKHDPDRDAPVSPSGIDHIAVSVDDTDGTFERLVSETDCEVVAEPATMDNIGVRVAFITDPDGYVVELVQQLD